MPYVQHKVVHRTMMGFYFSMNTGLKCGMILLIIHHTLCLYHSYINGEQVSSLLYWKVIVEVKEKNVRFLCIVCIHDKVK